MENQDNNNLNELEQLKAQYETLKERFDQQEIINDKLVKSVIQTNTDFFVRNRKISLIFGPILALLGFAVYAFSGYWTFGICLLLLVGLLIGVELWLTRNTRQKVMENSDLLTLSKNMQQLKTGYSIFIVSILVIAFLFVAFFTFKKLESQDAATSLNLLYGSGFFRVIWSLGFTGLLLLLFAIMCYRNYVGHCNNVIRQIDAVEGRPTTKKNMTFWYFLGAIVLVLAAGIFLTYQVIKPVTYSRPDNNLTSEGRLEIWEIYADTNIAEKGVPGLMAYWQANDSLVVMKGAEPKMEIGLDKEGDHAWKSETYAGNLVRLYALRKSTSEGPGISSSIMEGKPMVRSVLCGKYRKHEETPIVVSLTPEASQLWYQFTSDVTGHKAALVMDGAVIQDWQIMCGIETGTFFIMRNYSSKDEMKAFCKRLIQQ